MIYGSLKTYWYPTSFIDEIVGALVSELSVVITVLVGIRSIASSLWRWQGRSYAPSFLSTTFFYRHKRSYAPYFLFKICIIISLKKSLCKSDWLDSNLICQLPYFTGYVRAPVLLFKLGPARYSRWCCAYNQYRNGIRSKYGKILFLKRIWFLQVLTTLLKQNNDWCY